MPTILKWTYDGGDAGEDATAEMQAKAQQRGTIQRIHAGDLVDDDRHEASWQGTNPPKYNYRVKIEPE